jgi:hypothetical protein
MVKPMSVENENMYLQQLVDVIVPVATQLLEKHGGFNPFSAVIQSDGSPKLLAEASSVIGRPGKDPIQSLVDYLRGVIQDQKFKAIAICVNTHTVDHGDTLVLHYEDPQHNNSAMHLDYTIANHTVTWGEVTRERTEGYVYDTEL